MEASADFQLMSAVKNGDLNSFALLHQRHHPQVHRLLSRMTRNNAVADELSQEVFLRVYQARCRYEPTASFRTWLYRIAFNRALNWIRSQQAGGAQPSLSYDTPDTPVSRAMADPLPTPEQALLRREVIAAVRQAIEELPPRQRTALILHKYHGLEYSEIARRMDTSVSAVKSLLFRTYLTLQGRLAELRAARG